MLGGTLDSDTFVAINGRAVAGFHINEDDAGGVLIAAINRVQVHTGVRAELDRFSRIKLVAEDGRNIEVELTGNAHEVTGMDSQAGQSVTLSSLNLFSHDFFSISDPSESGGELTIGTVEKDLVGANDTEVVDTIDISTRRGANRALVILERAVEQALISISEMGGLENRLEFTVSRLNTAAKGAHLSRARLMEADVASEAMKMARSKILQQAFTHVLAQANTEPQRVMQLL